jgi:type II secretory pathway component HofQ
MDAKHVNSKLVEQILDEACKWFPSQQALVQMLNQLVSEAVRHSDEVRAVKDEYEKLLYKQTVREQEIWLKEHELERLKDDLLGQQREIWSYNDSNPIKLAAQLKATQQLLAEAYAEKMKEGK